MSATDEWPVSSRVPVAVLKRLSSLFCEVLLVPPVPAGQAALDIVAGVLKVATLSKVPLRAWANPVKAGGCGALPAVAQGFSATTGVNSVEFSSFLRTL